MGKKSLPKIADKPVDDVLHELVNNQSQFYIITSNSYAIYYSSFTFFSWLINHLYSVLTLENEDDLLDDYSSYLMKTLVSIIFFGIVPIIIAPLLQNQFEEVKSIEKKDMLKTKKKNDDIYYSTIIVMFFQAGSLLSNPNVISKDAISLVSKIMMNAKKIFPYVICAILFTGYKLNQHRAFNNNVEVGKLADDLNSDALIKNYLQASFQGITNVDIGYLCLEINARNRKKITTTLFKFLIKNLEDCFLLREDSNRISVIFKNKLDRKKVNTLFTQYFQSANYYTP